MPTGAVTRELYAWWLALRALFRSHEAVAIECMGRRFECSDLAGKIAALKAAASWVHQDYRRKFQLVPTFAAHGISPAALAEEYFLDCDELRALARHPLVTIGAHTTSHAALSTLEPGQARCEMADNKIGVCHDVLPCFAHVQRARARDARTPLVRVGEIDDRGGEQIGEAEERPAGLWLATKRSHSNDGRSSLTEQAGGIFKRPRISLRRRRGLEPGQIR